MGLPSTGNTVSYGGLYRGLVVDNLDPLQIDRLLVRVPSLSSQFQTEWALPQEIAGTIVIPPIGSQIWVQFEGGDVRYPIWIPQTQPVSQPLPQLRAINFSQTVDPAAFHRAALRRLQYTSRALKP